MRSVRYKELLKEMADIMVDYDTNHYMKYSVYRLGMLRTVIYSDFLDGKITEREFDLLEEKITNAYNRIG